jgi:hypothetical protein
MENIIENATILYTNGVKQLYDAVLITEKGIYIGRLRSKKGMHKDFEDHSFIPRDQIQKITVSNDKGKLRDIKI